MRLDIFQAKKAAEKNIKASGRKLTPEEARLVEKMIQDGTRAGLALPEKERTELMALKKELSNVCLEFSVRVAFRSSMKSALTRAVLEKLQRGEGTNDAAASRTVLTMFCRALSRSRLKSSKACPRMSSPDLPRRLKTLRSCTRSHTRPLISSLSYASCAHAHFPLY